MSVTPGQRRQRQDYSDLLAPSLTPGSVRESVTKMVSLVEGIEQDSDILHTHTSHKKYT